MLTVEDSIACAAPHQRCQAHGNFDHHSPTAHDSQSPISGLHGQSGGASALLHLAFQLLTRARLETQESCHRMDAGSIISRRGCWPIL